VLRVESGARQQDADQSEDGQQQVESNGFHGGKTAVEGGEKQPSRLIANARFGKLPGFSRSRRRRAEFSRLCFSFSP
jgi:hypothetical protein